MEIAIPERFHAGARGAHHGLVYGDQSLVDELAKVIPMLQGVRRQRAVPDNLAQQHPLRGRQIGRLVGMHLSVRRRS